MEPGCRYANVSCDKHFNIIKLDISWYACYNTVSLQRLRTSVEKHIQEGGTFRLEKRYFLLRRPFRVVENGMVRQVYHPTFMLPLIRELFDNLAVVIKGYYDVNTFVIVIKSK